MQLVLLYCRCKKNTWKLGKQSRKGYCRNTAIATDCTVHLDTKVYSDFTFTEMTVTGYYKTIFISTGTRIWHCDDVWHRRPSRKNHEDVFFFFFPKRTR